MATKLIENVDEDIWNKFAGYCKMEDKLVGEELNRILSRFLKQRGLIKNG